ncbi:MAG: nitronate monooxygenase [Phenylobacterium sp.]|uniref:NAD(P)H-dependent flavin oxidoreductase n=1 Tax=Phenylobacterium sp. TaxID=1871053 RepID=UPI0027370853|nr:nitronate monooxygenase [Phenylobacterium sp.]MDP3175995.1 nitronate monooxygenase [Phenylobacterium sp.]
MAARLPENITRRMRLPLIAAPMLRVSGPDLVIAACKAGVVGSFPTANARSGAELDGWLTRINAELAAMEPPAAPWCANLIIRSPRMADDLARLIRAKVEVVITSVGSPAAVVAPLRDAGCLVLADVATLRHAQKAIEAGADGLVLLTAGAGGQTGWMNPFAFVRAVRAIFDGPIVLAGGVADGQALWAARALGCDLAYMGTKLIATHESMAKDAYKAMLVEATLDDVMTTRAFTGLNTNMLLPSIRAAGLDPASLDEAVSVSSAAEMYGGGQAGPGRQRWVDVWSAGHSVSGVGVVQGVAEVIETTRREYLAAVAEVREMQP